MKFCGLASGSKGNCSYVETNNTKILIDAGISARATTNFLENLNIDISSIDGIIITHEHEDHIKGVSLISSKYNIPVYATEGTWEIMNNKVSNIMHQNKIYIYPNESFFINDIKIDCFPIEHDAAEPVGFSLYNNESKMTYITDTGSVNEYMMESFEDCNLVVIESNYDTEMMKFSSYPAFLRNRVLGALGHLSNDDAGEIIASILSPKLKYIFLAHLSKDNNMPDLALIVVKDLLKERGLLSDNFTIDLLPNYEKGIIEF